VIRLIVIRTVESTNLRLFGNDVPGAFEHLRVRYRVGIDEEQKGSSRNARQLISGHGGPLAGLMDEPELDAGLV
jgi:hypothetical protein